MNIRLPVLPDPQRMARILGNAEAHQQKRAMEANNSQPADQPPPASTPQQQEIEQKVVEALRAIYDPELPVNIYDLGLIYDVEVSPGNLVTVRMTLTAPACPVAESLPIEVESKVRAVPEVSGARVELVWDPPWSRERISEEAKLQLGLF